MGKQCSYSERELKAAVAVSRSWNQVITHLGLKPGGGTYKSLQAKAERLKLDLSGFVGQAWNKGDAHVNPAMKIPLDEILVEGSTYPTSKLRKRLVDAGLREWKCEECNLDTWQGHVIPLQTDHINGVNNDNRIENLRLLCPNCHALTPTWCGRNKAV